jgi:hypothetical protein
LKILNSFCRLEEIIDVVHKSKKQVYKQKNCNKNMEKQFKIIFTQSFEKRVFKYLEKSELKELDLFFENLEISPFLGKPISYNFFREKKINEKRVYFLIYEDLNLILFIGISNKKNQQKEIDKIKINFKDYKQYVLKLI